MRKAALLAAGDSTRMLPLSANMPKHMLPVAGKPLLFHTLGALREAGVEETLVIYGYQGEKLKAGIDAVDWSPMKVVYSLQKERRGTAHAASHARKFAGSDDIIVMNGDVMVGPGSFANLMEDHAKSGHRMTLSVISVEDPSPYAVVAVDQGRVTKLIEKPKPDQLVSNLANVGIYVAGPELWDAIDRTELSARGEYEITDSIAMLIQKGLVGAYYLPSWWLDIGKPWDLLKANELVLKGNQRRVDGTVEPGAVVKGNVVVERDALIRSGAYVEGPVFVDDDAVVGPNCYIRPTTSLGRGVKVGNAVEVKNSIIMESTSIGHLSYVGDSVIGRHVNFGAGTITANLRHDDRNIEVMVKGVRISSGRRKLGAIVGDNVKTGIGTSIAPGVVIYQNARTGIGVIVDRDVEPHTMVVVEQQKKTIQLEHPK